MRLNVWALLCVVTITSPASAFAGQAVDDGVLSLHLTVENGDQIAGTFPPQYRLYVEPESLRLSLALGNESGEPIVVEQRRIQELLRLRLDTGGANANRVAVTVQWPPEIRLPGEWTTKPTSWAPLTIEPHTGVSWIIVLNRGDAGVFDSGTYAVTYEVPNLQSIVRKATGSSWIGRTPSRPASVPLVIALPQTPREISAVHKLAARDALLRRDLGEMAAAYSRALAADPTDTMAVSGLANSLLILKRYAEAVPLYERLIKQGVVETRTYESAAEAYIGLGDDANARRVLSSAGYSPERIQTTLALRTLAKPYRRLLPRYFPTLSSVSLMTSRSWPLTSRSNTCRSVTHRSAAICRTVVTVRRITRMGSLGEL